MRAEVTVDVDQYKKGQTVKGATAKVLVARNKAKELTAPAIVYAELKEDFLTYAKGAIVKGDAAQSLIDVGKATEVEPTATNKALKARVKTHSATITS